MLAIGLPTSIVLAAPLHPVVAGVVCYIEHFIKQRVGLGLSRAGVLLREILVQRQPAKDRGSGGHVIRLADRAKALSFRYSLADDCHYAFAEICWPARLGHLGFTLTLEDWSGRAKR